MNVCPSFVKKQGVSPNRGIKVIWFMKTVHLQVRRTVKFLCGVGRGIPIVGPEWLVSCREANKFSGMNDAVQ